MKKNKIVGVNYLKKKYKFKIKELTKDDIDYLNKNCQCYIIPLEKFKDYVFIDYRGAEIFLLNNFSKEELIKISGSHPNLTKESHCLKIIKKWN